MSDFPVSLSTVADNVDDVLAKYINNIEAKLGINSSAVTTSHDYKLSGITDSDKAVSTGDGFDAWDSWEPVYTSLADGVTTYAKYIQIGKTVHFRLKYTFDGADCDGPISFTLPVNAHADYTSSVYEPLGTAVCRDTGTTGIMGLVMWETGQKGRIRIAGSAGTYVSTTDNTSAIVPFTWAATDELIIEGTYEAA